MISNDLCKIPFTIYNQRYYFVIKISLVFLILFITRISFSQTDTNLDTCLMYIPNTLSLDCEYGNDYQLKVVGSCTTESFQITVYNRWGEILYQSDDITEVWDAGEFPDGVYVYKIEGVWDNGFSFTQNGHLLLLK